MYLQLPDENQLKLIYGEFDINEEQTRERVKELITWLEHEPHLPNVTNEFFLRNYLLRCKNDMNRAKITLERYYITKAKMPDVFTNRDISAEDFKKCFVIASFVPLPKLTPEGYRVSVYRVNGRLDTKMPASAEYVKNSQIMGIVDMNSDFHQKSIVICDFQDISLPFISLMLYSLRRLLGLSTKVIPFRFHKIYILNAISAVTPLIVVAKTFAKKEIADRIEIWKKEAKDLSEVIPANILPSDYGGTEKTFNEFADMWVEELKRHQNWLNEEEKDVADLNVQRKRSKKTRTNSSNAEESDVCFRDLNLD